MTRELCGTRWNRRVAGTGEGEGGGVVGGKPGDEALLVNVIGKEKHLVVEEQYHDTKTGVVALEYGSKGRVVATGALYTNRYISVLTITDRKITRWRDYLDLVAVFDALGWPE